MSNARLIPNPLRAVYLTKNTGVCDYRAQEWGAATRVIPERRWAQSDNRDEKLASRLRQHGQRIGVYSESCTTVRRRASSTAQVTVLFADLKGSMELLADRDHTGARLM